MNDSNKAIHLETRDIGAMPGHGSGKSNNKQTMDRYVVKYLKTDIDDAAGLLELSSVETRALRADAKDPEIVLIDKSSFTFMDHYYIILKYIQRL